MRKVSVLLSALLTGVVLGVAPRQASAAETDHIFCYLTDTPESTRYYSDLFQGDFNDAEKYQGAFRDYLRAHYDHVSGTAACKFDKDPKEARTKRDRDMAQSKNVYKALVETGWKY